MSFTSFCIRKSIRATFTFRRLLVMKTRIIRNSYLLCFNNDVKMYADFLNIFEYDGYINIGKNEIRIKSIQF